MVRDGGGRHWRRRRLVRNRRAARLDAESPVGRMQSARFDAGFPLRSSPGDAPVARVAHRVLSATTRSGDRVRAAELQTPLYAGVLRAETVTAGGPCGEPSAGLWSPWMGDTELHGRTCASPQRARHRGRPPADNPDRAGRLRRRCCPGLDAQLARQLERVGDRQRRRQRDDDDGQELQELQHPGRLRRRNRSAADSRPREFSSCSCRPKHPARALP